MKRLANLCREQENMNDKRLLVRQFMLHENKLYSLYTADFCEIIFFISIITI